jgi:uncharacterized protein YydD (DUF2326 family)
MNAIEAAIKELRERRAQLSDALANRAAKTFEEYQFICGEIRGLTAVETYLIDLAKRMEHEDD